MKSWVPSVLSRLSKTARARLLQAVQLDSQRRRKSLRLEFLEPRLNMAPGDATLVGNDLLAEGTTGDDIIIISQTDGNLYLARINDEQFGPFAVPGIVRVVGDLGNDVIVLNNIPLNSNLDGGGGDDFIFGSLGNDTIVGGQGSDRINASEGNNTVWGDDLNQQAANAGSADVISTMGGDDVVYGGGGNDQLKLGLGNDYAFGGFGDDLIGGQGGNDRIYGGAGNDVASGDEGNDLLVGNDGNDQLLGRIGRDVLIGSIGNDQLNGNEDVDLLLGRGTTNEVSTVAGDANDVALTTSLNTWVATTPVGLLTPVLGPTDGGGDTLFGFTGGDRFYGDQLDNLADFNLPLMGTDSLEVFAGSAALPPGSPVAPGTAALVGADLVIQGTALSDRIIINPVDTLFFDVDINGVPFGPFNVPAPGIVLINAGDGDDYVEVRESLISVTVNGENGNDYIATSGGNDTITGGLGDDQINASSGNNVVWGDNVNEQALATGGNDKISTLGGADIVYGGGGNDELNVGAGDDHAYGGFGNDLIGGEDGIDRLYGGAGNDTISGDAGNDLIVGNDGNDILLGRTGRDVLVGGLGVDRLDGGEDEDVLIGRGLTNDGSTTSGDANDTALFGLFTTWTNNPAGSLGIFVPVLGADDGAIDTLYGFTGDDDFYADLFDLRPDFRGAFMGNDRLVPFPGGAAMPPGSVVPPGAAALVGNDLVVQGTILGDTVVVSPAGPDTVKVLINGVVFGGFLVPGNIVINGDAGDDSLQVVNTTINAVIDGGPGQDYITGSLGNDTLIGGLGADQINAAEGNNTIYGDLNGPENALDGSDTISTLGGNDVAYGNGGNDQISLGAGNDYAYGGTGNDVLQGFEGNDRLYGGAGNDTLSGNDGDDLLAGNAGNDQLTGGNGRDVLIGGTGVDTLNGGADDDVIIGRALTNEASTQFNDANDTALAALLAQWVATTPAGLFTPFLAANDGSKDSLLGGSGADDFYADVNDTVGDFQLGIDQRIVIP